MIDNDKEKTIKDEKTEEQGTVLSDENLSFVSAGNCPIDTTSKKNTEATGTEEQGSCLK